MVVHAFNPSPQEEAEAGRALSLRPAWCTQRNPVSQRSRGRVSGREEDVDEEEVEAAGNGEEGEEEGKWDNISAVNELLCGCKGAEAMSSEGRPSSLGCAL